MKKLILAFSCLAPALGMAALQDAVTPAGESAVSAIAPIFGQLLMFSFPAGFTTVFENSKGASYIREAVLHGENVDHWSQMITVSGRDGVAANPTFAAPSAFANAMAGGFRNACPNSFSASGLGAFKISGYDAFAAVMSCGVANASGAGYAESTLVIAIKGERAYYTIQWAERGAASATPLRTDDAKWLERLKKLLPVRLCPVVQGEAPPYPSCSGNRPPPSPQPTGKAAKEQ